LLLILAGTPLFLLLALLLVLTLLWHYVSPAGLLSCPLHTWRTARPSRRSGSQHQGHGKR
jgi:hypothetical protein